MTRRSGRFGFVAMITVSLLAACGGGAATGSPTANAVLKSLTVAVPNDPGVLAFDAIGIGTYSFTRLLYAGLFRIRAATNSYSTVQAEAAESWTTSADAKTYTFHLRPGIKFSDGSPITSADVKNSIQIMLKPQYSESGFISEIATVDTPDPQTVVINLSAGDSGFWPLISEVIDIFPAAAVQSQGEAQYQKNPMVTSGPYQLVEYKTNQDVVLKRNPNYWGTKPPFDQITFKIVSDTSSRVNQLLTGGVQVASIDVANIPQIQGNSNLHLVAAPPPGVEYVGLRFDKAPTNDVRVRQAMNYAIDRQALLKVFASGHALVNTSILAPYMAGATTRKVYTYDPAKARQLLADYGKPVSINFDVTSTQANSQLAQALANYWQAVGITVNIVTLDAGTFFSKEKGGSAGGGTLDPAFLGTWSGATDPSEIIVNLVATGGFFSFDSIPSIDDTVKKAAGTSDQAVRTSAFASADNTCLDMACWVFLWYPDALFGEAKNVTVLSTPEGPIDLATARVSS